MRIDIITCKPELLESALGHSIIKRATDGGQAKIVLHDLREYGMGKHKKIDDYCYGGGAGMVLMAEPIVRCIEGLQADRVYDEIVYMAPDGIPFTQQVANKLSLYSNLILLCGHYKGIDERIRAHFVTSEISIGPYVLTGGELPAALVTDSVVRLIPGVLSDSSSALSDSYQDGRIAPPVYTRPASFRGMQVPDVLLSGNTSKIELWREEKSLERTQKRAPYLLLEKKTPPSSLND